MTESAEFLIDSGAVYSIVPRPVLERLGIVLLAEYNFRLSNGQVIRRRTGAALYKYQDRVSGTPVVFGEDGDSPLLGMHTLTALGLGSIPSAANWCPSL